MLKTYLFATSVLNVGGRFSTPGLIVAKPTILAPGFWPVVVNVLPILQQIQFEILDIIIKTLNALNIGLV